MRVSVVVPARNEEASLGACLMSLAAQRSAEGPGAQSDAREHGGLEVEVVVVDDGSTDRTRAIAEFIAGVRVMSAPPLPQGWCGKANACQAGAEATTGEWLLFTDADTVHAPGSLARALAEAEEHGAALLSYSPAQEVRGFAERALMPLVFAELAAIYPPRDVCDLQSETAAANGQFLLVRREAYEAVGGHAAVAGDLLEDVALARRVKRSGRKLRFRYGGDVVRTRMYRTWPQMREGWTKNLALLFPEAQRLEWRRTAEFVGSAGALAVAGAALLAGRKKTALVVAAMGAVATAKVVLRARRAHFDAWSTALAPLGLPLFAYLLRRSRICHREGRVQWKGREYRCVEDPRGEGGNNAEVAGADGVPDAQVRVLGGALLSQPGTLGGGKSPAVRQVQ